MGHRRAGTALWAAAVPPKPYSHGARGPGQGGGGGNASRMGTSSGRSLNLAAVYKPAGGGSSGHCGRQGPRLGLEPLAPPGRASLPGPPLRLPGNGVNTHCTTAAGRDPRGTPWAPACAWMRRTRSGGGIRDPGLPAGPRGLPGSLVDGVNGPQRLTGLPRIPDG